MAYYQYSFHYGKSFATEQECHNCKLTLLRGTAKKNKFQKSEITMEVGAYQMNSKLDANSLPKLSKEKRLSLDMHAETISVI